MLATQNVGVSCDQAVRETVKIYVPSSRAWSRETARVEGPHLWLPFMMRNSPLVTGVSNTRDMNSNQNLRPQKKIQKARRRQQPNKGRNRQSQAQSQAMIPINIRRTIPGAIRAGQGFSYEAARMGRTNLVSGEQAANSLQLHSPQLGHTTSVFFEARKGTTPGGMVVGGRELLGTALTATNAAGAYVLTQAIVQCFATWTARWVQFAALYQKWRLRALRATFVSSLGTTTVGDVYLSFQTDPTAAGPASGAAQMRENGAVFGNAYSDLVSEFDCRSATVPWFQTAPGGGTVSTASAGVLNIGTDSFTSAVVPGKVVVDYEIEFADPL